MMERSDKSVSVIKLVNQSSPISAMFLLAMMLMIGNAITWETDDSAVGRIRTSLDEISDQFHTARGTWIQSRVVPIPSNQENLLGLTAHLSREYQRLGVFPPITAILFIAYCADARSMTGHHPPNCYPSSGWQLETADTRHLNFDRHDGRVMEATAYHFARDSRIMVVINGFFAEGGHFLGTLEEANKVVKPSLLGGQGLFQFQILLQGDHSDADVEQYAGEILDAIPGRLFDVVDGRHRELVRDASPTDKER